MNNKIKDRGADRDEIQQIQLLMLLCLGLSPQDKLHQFLEMALAASGSQTVAKATPPDDVSNNGIFDWLTSLLGHEDLKEEERSLMIWQNDPRNMLPAINELKAIQKKIGIKISIQKT